MRTVSVSTVQMPSSFVSRAPNSLKITRSLSYFSRYHRAYSSSSSVSFSRASAVSSLRSNGNRFHSGRTAAYSSLANRNRMSSSLDTGFLSSNPIGVPPSSSSSTSSSSAVAFSTTTASSTSTATTALRYPTEILQPRVQTLLREITAVCFDVDSTVVTVEGIDEFAAHAGKKEAVAALTKAAMGGSVPFDVALENRLRIINPTRTILDQFLLHHPFHFTPGIEEVIHYLQTVRRIPVYLVSGGFTQMIYPVADRLQIPRERVFANTILFDPVTGHYTGFDRTAFTSRDGGKAEVISYLKTQYRHYGTGVVVMVGDGATDLQARPPADLMIGYGGIIVRETVAKGADWFVRDFFTVLKELHSHETK